MLRQAVVEKEVHQAREKGKVAITRALNGMTGDYDVLDHPYGEEDFGAIGPEAAWDGDPVHRDLGPPQAETIPLEDAPNPFPMLDSPVEF